MSQIKEIIIPTFVNAHLFWIIEKKDILLRCAMEKIMKTKCKKAKINFEQDILGKMFALNLENKWARAIVEDVVSTQDHTYYFCWLPDYGVMRMEAILFTLPQELEECPPLARQASLSNVVNLRPVLELGENGYEMQLHKTTNSIEGVRKSVLYFIEVARKLYFSLESEDEFNLYGDIICTFDENHEESMTELLIGKNLVEVDSEMFRSIDQTRTQFKNAFYKQSANCHQELDTTEKKIGHIVFNTNLQ